jgi:C4-dicarboxylate transporter DctM subunit
MIGLVIAVLFALMIISVPISFSLGGASLVGYFVTGTAMEALAQKMVIAVAKYSLLPLPFFVFSGALMSQGGISKRLIAVVRAFIGHRTGGVAIVTVVSAMIFAALSGSSSATTAALGAILIPAMIEHHYSKEYASSITAVSSELGMIIPPSISMIIYGVATETSIARLFAGGFMPGILIGGSLMFLSYILCRKKGYKGTKKSTWAERGAAVKYSWLALLMPVVVLGGIYAGIFTATESAIISVVYAFIVGTFVYREITWEGFKKAVTESLITIGMVTMVVASALAFSWLLTREQIPQKMAILFGQIAPNYVVFLLLVNILLIITGMFFDSTSAVSILSIILMPVAVAFGIDPVHFGVIMVVNMALGCVTPPVGVNLFVACRIGQVKIEDMIKELAPYWLVLIADLMIISYVPHLTLFLPGLIR